MIFTSYEIEISKNIAIVHLKCNDASYVMPVLNMGYDLRNKHMKTAIAKKAVEKLNEKYNTKEFIEVF